MFNKSSSPASDVPTVFQDTFSHLVKDIVGFGILNGSAISFITVYAARLGATNWQLGILTALPALVTLGLALPVGGWLKNRPITAATRWSAMAFRVFYLTWVLLPLLGASARQLDALMLTVLLMSVPGTVLAICFNALYAAAVPPEWRGHVMTRRQTSYAATSILVSLGCGALLDLLPFPVGYQVVFAIGFLGGAYSTWQLWQIRPNEAVESDPLALNETRAWVQPGFYRVNMGVRIGIGLRSFAQHRWRQLLQLDVLTGHFRTVLLLLFAMHFAQYISIPLHAQRYVNELKLSDGVIGIGNALFYAALYLVAMQYTTVRDRLGDRRALGLAITLMSFYPLSLAGAQGAGLFWLANVFGGSGVAILMGSTGNYLLSEIPDTNRAPYLAWYNLLLNAAALIGSLVGPALADATSLSTALVTAFFLRVGSGWLLWRRADT